MEKIETMKCPVCRGEVKGNDSYKFLCLKCKILFERHHIEGKLFDNKYKPEESIYRLFEQHR
jgi:hypothetical protein